MKVNRSERAQDILVQGQAMPSGSMTGNGSGTMPTAINTSYTYGPDDCCATDSLAKSGHPLMFRKVRVCVITDQVVTLKIFQGGDGDAPTGSQRYWQTNTTDTFTPAAPGTAQAFFREYDIELRWVKYELRTTGTVPNTTSNSANKFEFQRTLIPIN